MSRTAARRPVAGVTGALLALAVGVAFALVPTTAGATTSKTVSVAPGASAWFADGSAFTDGSAVATFTVPSRSASPVQVALQFRGTSGHDGYRTTLAVGADGSTRLSISRINQDKETTLAATTLASTYAVGTKVSLGGSLSGSSPVSLRARTWASAGAPPDWQVTTSDSDSRRLTGVASPAKVGLTVARTATSATSTALTLVGSPAVQATSTKVRQLTSSDVGVPAGTTLRPVYGDLTVTQAGTVVSGIDLHGFLIVKAANVTVRNSLIRGGPGKAYHLGLITSVDQPNLVVEDSDLRRDTPSVMNDGILGNNYTLRRVHVTGGVDNVKVEGDNVRVESSLLEGLDHFDHDPSQNGGASHNDSIQILEGRNVVVTGTTALATDNFALLGGAEWGDITLTATGNYLDGGHCNAKLQVRNGHALTATVTGNVFGPHRTEQSCPLVAEKAVNLTQSGNVLAANGLAVAAIRIYLPSETRTAGVGAPAGK